jgi:Zn-dependent peptidase ImmA (M78 family)
MTRKDIEKYAERLLAELGINEMPIPVNKIAEHAGCQVKAFDDDKDGVSGVFMVNNSIPMIGYNSNQSPVRQRFTIAHELGHFILHSHNDPKEVYVDHNTFPLFRDENSSTGASIVEQQANAFAAALLMPERLITEEVKNLNLDLTDESAELTELAKKFNVSIMAMSIRLVNLHLVHGNGSNKRKTTFFRDSEF